MTENPDTLAKIILRCAKMLVRLLEDYLKNKR